MKRLSAFLLLSTQLFGEMKYDPVRDCFFSKPETSEINLLEYNLLLRDCLIIQIRGALVSMVMDTKAQDLERMSHGQILDRLADIGKNRPIRHHIYDYLKNIHTPTAQRLRADLKKHPNAKSLLSK